MCQLSAHWIFFVKTTKLCQPLKTKLWVLASVLSGLSLSDFFARTQVHQSISEYCLASSLDVLIIMFLYFVESLDDPPSRQIAVCGPHNEAKSKIAENLSTSGELNLRLYSERFQNCFVYDQENITASRKVVFPLVLDIIKNRFWSALLFYLNWDVNNTLEGGWLPL